MCCVNLADRTEPSEIIDAAKEKDIPIIFFNREPVEEDMRRWDKLYYVGGKAKQSGELQGELAADFIKVNPQADRNNDGKIQYVILEGEMGHQDAIIRTESVVESLKANDISLEKLSYQIANWNRAQAQTRMMQLIGQYKTNIEMVIANSDSMALGAIDAYEKLGYTESNIPVFLVSMAQTKVWKPFRKVKSPQQFITIKKGRRRQWQSLSSQQSPERKWRIFSSKIIDISICRIRK